MIVTLASGYLLAAVLQAAEPRTITGRFERLVAESAFTQIELILSDDRDLPSVSVGDRVYRASLPLFRLPGSPGGLRVAFAETASGGFLFVDANFDGRLTEGERVAASLRDGVNSRDSLTIPLQPPNAPVMSMKCGLIARDGRGRTGHYLMYTPTFRAEGYAEIGGTPTLISLPYNLARGNVDIRRGMIGIDTNGDGRIERQSLSGGEVTFLNDEEFVFKVRDRYVSFASADFAVGSFVLMERRPDEYRVVQLALGVTLPDFTFTDQHGVAGRLSDFKGKHVLLDFWGTWCPPCVAEISELKDIHARFRDRGFEILGMDSEVTVTAGVPAFLAEHGVTWRNAAPETVSDLIKNRFRIMAFPTHVLIDPSGTIVEFPVGPRTLAETLDRMLPRR